MFFTLVFPSITYAQEDTTILINDVLPAETGVQIRDDGSAPEVDPVQIVIDTRAGDNRRQAFVKFDFSKYADCLDDITKIDFLYEFEQSVVPAVAGGAASWQNFSVYLIPKNLKDLWNTQMTYAQAQESGLLSNDYVIHSGYMYYSLSDWKWAQFENPVDFTDAVLNYLKNSDGDMEVLLRFDSTASDLVALLRGFSDVSSPRMTISYNKSVNEILQEAYDDFTFDKISDELATDVHNDLNLFTRYKYGTTITWSADDPCIDLTSDNYTGSVNWTEDKDVTLTATFENSGLTKTREYKISVKAPYIKTENWLVANNEDVNYYRNGYHAPFNYANTGATQLQMAAKSGSDWRVAFAEFDLSSCLTSENTIEEAYFKIKTLSPVASGGYALMSILPQEMEDVWTSDLSHKDAEKAGLINYDVADTSDYIAWQDTTFVGSNIAGAINRHLRANPGDSKIVIRIESLHTSPTVFDNLALCVLTSEGEIDADIPEGGDPEGGDPEGGDPEGGDPEGGDPEGGNPEGGNPEGGVPDTGEPMIPIYAIAGSMFRNDSRPGENAPNPTIQALDGRGGGSQRDLMFMFDLSAYKSLLDKGGDLNFRYTHASFPIGSATASDTMSIILYPQELEAIWSNTMDYWALEQKGFLDYNTTISTFPLGGVGTHQSPNLLDEIKAHLEANTEDSKVLLRIKNNSTTAVPYMLGMNNTPADSNVALVINQYPAIIEAAKAQLTLDKLTDDPADKIRRNLSLPSSLANGVEVSWKSSDESVINSATGVVTWPYRDKKVTLTATLSLKGNTKQKEFVLNVVEPYPAMDQTLTTSKSNFYYRYDATPQDGGYQYVLDGRPGPTRKAYLEFDFADFMNMGIRGEDIEEAYLTYYVRYYAEGGSAYSPIRTSVISQEAENSWENNDNFESFEAAGGFTSATDYIENICGLAESSQKTANLAMLIRKHFNNNENDSKIVVMMETTDGGALVLGGYDDYAPTLEIKVRDRGYVALDYSALTDEDSACITKNLTLPKNTSVGDSIKWTSDNESVINSETGAVTRPAYGQKDANVTLTATYTNGRGIIFTKAFYFNVLSMRENPNADETRLLPVDIAYVTGGDSADDVMTNNKLMVSDDNQQAAFIKFDLSSLKESDDFVTMQLRLAPSKSISDTNAAFNIAVTGSSSNNWNSETLTYNKAQTMLSEGGSGIDVIGAATANKLIYSSDIMSLLGGTYYDIEGDIITIKLTSKDNTFEFFGNAQAQELMPALILKDDTATVEDAYSQLTFDKISSESIDGIRNNVNLMKSFNGVDVKWTSSNESVIDSDGNVTRGQTNQQVVLTAKLSLGDAVKEKKFTVNVVKHETDEEYLQFVLSSLEIDETIVTKDFELPVLDGFDIKWTTNREDMLKILDNKASVSLSDNKDENVELVATVSKGSANADKAFNLKLLRKPSKSIFVNARVLSNDQGFEDVLDADINNIWTPSSNEVIHLDAGKSKAVKEFVFVTNSKLSGLKISSSADGNRWDDLTGEITHGANGLVYYTLHSQGYARYFKITLPTIAEGIKALYAYSDTTLSDTVVSWDEISIPKETSENFNLPKVLGSFELSWKSSNTDAIVIDDYTAVVKTSAKNQNVVLTASYYENNKLIERKYNVIVKGKNTSESSGGGKGSSFGSGAHIPFSPQIDSTVATYIPFADLNDAQWAKEHIVHLYQNGIVNGKGEGIFAPNDFLTREELAKIITVAFKLSKTGDANMSFEDVPSDAWYYDYILALSANNLTNGIGNNQFGVGLNITRQDAATQIANILQKCGVEADSVDTAKFPDDANIADYAKDSVYYMRALGILQGDENGYFNPTSSITRAEISKIICIALGFVR